MARRWLGNKSAPTCAGLAAPLQAAMRAGSARRRPSAHRPQRHTRSGSRAVGAQACGARPRRCRRLRASALRSLRSLRCPAFICLRGYAAAASGGAPGGDLISAGWPTFDATQIEADEVEYPVQVMGKVRGKLTFPRSLTGADLEAAVRAHPTVVDIVGTNTVRKLVIVPFKIINLVLG